MKKGDLFVISLGGSRIVPAGSEKADSKFLREFKKIIDANKNKRFVVVTGGGSVARKYISAARDLNLGIRKQSSLGIKSTRLNASFLMKIFGKPANDELPKNMRQVKSLLKKNQIVFCGGLRYKAKNTSDGTAAGLAGYLGASFINITNVKGMYDDNPKTNKNAKFIKKISWKDFYSRAKKIKYKAGQHFVLDQTAAKVILKKKIPTYIVGSLSDVNNIIKGKSYQGSLICG
jgi:uridylate kinase